jgi:corrinoid protein of di/trimethylamine methyltransferase
VKEVMYSLTGPHEKERKDHMEKTALFESMKNSILEGNKAEAERLAQLSLDQGIDPKESISQGYTGGIQAVGKLWEDGEYFLPELVVSAEAMKAAMKVLEKSLQESARHAGHGKMVIGTVQGDIHDIGKSLAASIFSANGFEVIDLGMDVPIETFVEKAQAEHAQIIGMSALLTTTMVNQRKVIELLEQKGIRKNFKILVGGAPVSREWAQRIGADDASLDAFEAVAKVKEMLAREVHR